MHRGLHLAAERHSALPTKAAPSDMARHDRSAKSHRLLLSTPCAGLADPLQRRGGANDLPFPCGDAALASADAIVTGPNDRRMENAVDQQHSFNPASGRPGIGPADGMQAMIRPGTTIAGRSSNGRASDQGLCYPTELLKQ